MTIVDVPSYTFNPGAKTITLNEYLTVGIENVVMIINETRQQIMYTFAEPVGTITAAGNVLTLSINTTGMLATDKLLIKYSDPFAASFLRTGNGYSNWQDGIGSAYANGFDPNVWDSSIDTAGSANHFVNSGGDANGSQYVRMSLDPFAEDSGITLISKQSFRFPFRQLAGVSISQRLQAQETFVGFVACNDDGSIDNITTKADVAITGATIVVSANVGTITATAHGLKGNDRVSIQGCPISALNVGPVLVTVVDPNTITLPITAINGSYNSTGGVIKFIDPIRSARDGAGFLFDTTSATTGIVTSRRNGDKYYESAAATVSTTAATQSTASPYSDAHINASLYQLVAQPEVIRPSTVAVPSSAGFTPLTNVNHVIPRHDRKFKLVVRTRNLPSFSKPIARITGIAKTGTTTATVTTDVPHGLSVAEGVSIIGVRDQTNFINSGSLLILSVPTTTTFTVTIAGAATASSAGGFVIRQQGGSTSFGIPTGGGAIQSISRTNGVLSVVANAAWSGPLPGEWYNLYGLDGGGAAYEGAYKVLRVSTTTLELASPNQADFASVNCGGGVIRRTDVRLHYMKCIDYSRTSVDIASGGAGPDVANSVVIIPASGSSMNAIQGTQGVFGTTTWSVGGMSGALVVDVASSPITTTTTSSTITPGVNPNVGCNSHTFGVVVTAVSGTTPTLDVQVQESPDNGTNWVPIYDFERITAAGSYISPQIPAKLGTRYRYVQTIAGTTPSFTRAVNRIQHAQQAPFSRRFIDRSVVLTTLNSTTPVYNVDGCDTAQILINIGTASTAPILQLEGSEDGTNFYSIGATLTAVASSTVQLIVSGIMPKFVRVRVSTAGVTVVAGYLLIKTTGK